MSRTAEAESDDDSEHNAGPSTQRGQRRPPSPPDEEGDTLMGEDGATQAEIDDSSQDQMVKKLVRLALASEYARLPIRRADIATKVLGPSSRQTRVFRQVFDAAQEQLRHVFGMEMAELPTRDKVSLQQKRSAAQKADKAPAHSNAWILTSILPEKYHNPIIIPPPKVPTAEAEAQYVGLYTFVVAMISLAGGTLQESKFDRMLKRTNADQYTPLDKTDRLIQRMIKDGYIVRNKDTSNGEENVEYIVGPRGKVEIGDEGVMGLVRTVYGDDAPQDLERRLERSLNLREKQAAAAAAAAATRPLPEEVPKRRGRPSRVQNNEDDDEESDDD